MEKANIAGLSVFTERSVILSPFTSVTRHLENAEKSSIDADKSSSVLFSDHLFIIREYSSGLITIGPPWFLKIVDELESLDSSIALS